MPINAIGLFSKVDSGGFDLVKNFEDLAVLTVIYNFYSHERPNNTKFRKCIFLLNIKMCLKFS